MHNIMLSRYESQGKVNLVINKDKRRAEFNIFQGKLKTRFCYIKFYARRVTTRVTWLKKKQNKQQIENLWHNF